MCDNKSNKEIAMTPENREKIELLRDTFRLNYELTRLYASYLEKCPELITREMVEMLLEDGELSREQAIIGLLSEAFGIDVDRGSTDRRVIRDYLTPSVRILDKERYTSNPYYQNIKLDNVKNGNWEIKKEKYPAYRAVIAHDMMFFPFYREVPPLGFFTEDFEFPAVLEDSNEWMTLTPVDLDTCEDAIREARGKVVTFGLGLGYYAYMVSEKEDVESLTIVEISDKVIELFETYILPQFPHKEKIRIVKSDAFLYAEKVMPKENFDLAFVDTWRDASDGAPMYEKMKRLEKYSPNTRFMYWIENFLISRLRSLKYEELCRRVDNGEDISYREFCHALDNPLD